MDATGTQAFAMMVNLPRSYAGRAELRVGSDSVTPVARPLRHYRAIVLSCVGACADDEDQPVGGRTVT